MQEDLKFGAGIRPACCRLLTHTLGFPRIGADRELKTALESFWAGQIGERELAETTAGIRMRNWRLQVENGIDLVPVGDFSLYDHVLDTAVMLDLVPARFRNDHGRVDLAGYFRMARGEGGGGSLRALELSKWFDTNYHYIVPELDPDMSCRPDCSALLKQMTEAKEAGLTAKPVLLGPVTFLRLSKPGKKGHEPLDLAGVVVQAYEQILQELKKAAEWIQIDEPVLALDMSERERALFAYSLPRLIEAASGTKVLLATYFGSVLDNLEVACHPGLGALHLDLATAPQQLSLVLKRFPDGPMLSLGVVNGRNVWRVDLDAALAQVREATGALGNDRVMLGTSCSLLHVPIDLDKENGLDPRIRSRLAFAVQKCRELRLIADLAADKSQATVPAEYLSAECRGIEGGQLQEKGLGLADVRERCAGITADMLKRKSNYEERRKAQSSLLELPVLPTTTIGSFPQTRYIREARRKYKQGLLGSNEYEEIIRGAISECVDKQEELGLDVLVHGEAERNDMVEYFAEQLDGFCVTENGWVQSYGSRCVRPPIIAGDVARRRPMTVRWISFAQSLTTKPVKGVLTGPVTMLKWSFVREDLSPGEVCKQLALAIRDEVADLEASGVRIIQVDEPALREALPLRQRDQAAYLAWATEAFRLATSGVRDETQIHSHMCYGDFTDIMDWIVRMDCDVISMEASRSNMEILEALRSLDYPNEIGPGIWDVHSPRIPSPEEMVELITRALEVVPPQRLWVNPDCGLKTRGWCETYASLKNMVAAAAAVREKISPCKEAAGGGTAL